MRQLEVEKDRKISMKEAEDLIWKLNNNSALVPRGVRYRSLLMARKSGFWVKEKEKGLGG
jgi:hypothetical protein